MAITINSKINPVNFSGANPINIIDLDLTLDNSYITGGYDLKKLDFLDSEQYTLVSSPVICTDGSSNLWAKYDIDNEKLIILQNDLTEVVNGTDLSSYSCRLVCFVY